MPIINNDVRVIVGTTVVERIRKRLRENRVKPPTSKSGGTTLIGSGRLKNSIHYQIQGVKIPIGTNLRYARIQHEGGVITPKNAKFLAIPMTAAARAKSPRDFEDTFIRKGVIFRKLDDGKVEALYVLKKSVTIPARPYMFIDATDLAVIKQRLYNYWRENGKI